jgi:holo-[acyl-carrier protein] synthase
VKDLIVGNGIDMIEIGRIAEAIQNYHFTERVFTPAEVTETDSKSYRLAGFFAAKEALLKAMGTGLSGFSWQEMEVRHNPQGAPYFEVTGKVAHFLKVIQVTRIHLSISHCREYAIANVILEKGD